MIFKAIKKGVVEGRKSRKDYTFLYLTVLAATTWLLFQLTFIFYAVYFDNLCISAFWKIRDSWWVSPYWLFTICAIMVWLLFFSNWISAILSKWVTGIAVGLIGVIVTTAWLFTMLEMYRASSYESAEMTASEWFIRGRFVDATNIEFKKSQCDHSLEEFEFDPQRFN